MKAQDHIKKWYDRLSMKEKRRVRDIFLEMLKARGDIEIIEIRDLQVDWEFKPDSKIVQKIAKGIISRDKMDKKQAKKYKVKQDRYSDKWQSQAIKKYMKEKKVI